LTAIPTEDLQDLYDNAPCGYLSALPDGRIVRANATLAAWTGYAPEQLTALRFHDLLTVGTRILYETSFAPLLTLQGFANEISLDLRTATGGALAVSGSGALIRDADGDPSVIRIVLLKATDRRRYEGQLVAAREKSRKSESDTRELLKGERETSELREQFIAVLGHDLRNPLASISAGARMLRKGPPAEQRDQLLETIQGSVTRMAALIDNVLDFARGRLGSGIPLELRPVLLTPVLEQVVSELRLGHSHRRIDTDFDLPQPIRCDPSRIGQLVSNLVANALTHGAPGEPVGIQAGCADGALTISVVNSGAPIAPAAMERLFEPFFRGEVRSSQQGLGLGLHIASEIAKAHKGELTMVSSEAQTRFVFRMALDGCAAPLP